jgi:hypothetical protein
VHGNVDAPCEQSLLEGADEQALAGRQLIQLLLMLI